ncbi:isocitrate lyase/PEP mutase family protein [Kineosporia succinea]|uniref:2-methylisocitrate lyase-like PEP mutase family enzyme n=1 Tax=Kineosporia succinea TaxID=84632 RepID=A0ABT9PE90_9ACTN|nr:isocitrate lyase/phosphoenolpyruvate mutase family protein [Kineosporia succinea]MDP9831021.1 2-methylisocitrate lyase-like PEP mutase family enzyme [Kineosporia succinea]
MLKHALGETFAQMHRPGTPLVVPNPWDAGSARLLEQLGFRALATTSGGLAFSRGVRDGSVSRSRVLENLAEIVQATSLPVTADLESGYGERPEDVADAVRLAADAGAVGCSIEDTTGVESAPIRPLPEARERAEAAVAAARELDFPFTLTLRADNFFAGVPDLDDTVRRLRMYEEAGADVVYAPGLRDLDSVRQVVQAVSVPVNVLAIPGFSVDALAGAGVARVSVGSWMARSAYAAVIAAGEELLKAGTTGPVLPYAELNARMS